MSKKMLAVLDSAAAGGATQSGLREPDIWQFTVRLGVHERNSQRIGCYTHSKAVADAINSGEAAMVLLEGEFDQTADAQRGFPFIVTAMETDFDLSVAKRFGIVRPPEPEPEARVRLGETLTAIGLSEPGISRDQEFFEAVGAVCDQAVARIEAMMGGPLSEEHKGALYQVMVAVSDKAGPQLEVSYGDDAGPTL